MIKITLTQSLFKAIIFGNMLYDMTNDKKQNIDISNLPESKELIKKYSIKLEEMRNYVNKDPFQNQSN